MTETLIGPDGKPIDLATAEREFSAAMAQPSPSEPEVPSPPKVDPEAPFGRNKTTGEPNKRRPGPGRSNKARVASPATHAPESATEAQERRKGGIEGLVQITAAGCLAASTRFGESFRADAVILAGNAAPLAEACAQVASQDERFARILDKVTSAGPYGALIITVIPIAAQIAANHGVRAAQALGAVPPEQLLAQVDNENQAPGA